jgi:hypothetical protein
VIGDPKQPPQQVNISILKNTIKQQDEKPDASAVLPNSGSKTNDDMRLRLHDVIVFLKKQGYALENTFISFYSSIFSAYVNCNLDPVSKTIWLTDEDLEIIDGQLSLRLKF